MDADCNVADALSPVAGLGRVRLSDAVERFADLAVDLHNLIQKWSVLNNNGKSIISSIASVKVKVWDKENEDSVPSELGHLCDDLDAVVNQMESLVKQMRKIGDQCLATVQLDLHHRQKQDSDLLEPKGLLLTWPMTKFGEAVSDIIAVYEEELKVKRCIAANVAHCEDRGTFNLHKIAWVYQVNISPAIKLKLESLLVECNLR